MNYAFILVTEAIDERLRDHGFKRIPFPPEGPRDWNRPGRRLYGDGKRSVVVVTAIEIFPPWSCPPATPKRSSGRKIRRPLTVDDFFREILRDLLETGARNVILQGGGTIPIPEWFANKCAELGIKISIVGYDLGPNPCDFRHDGVPDFTETHFPFL